MCITCVKKARREGKTKERIVLDIVGGSASLSREEMLSQAFLRRAPKEHDWLGQMRLEMIKPPIAFPLVTDLLLTSIVHGHYVYGVISEHFYRRICSTNQGCHVTRVLPSFGDWTQCERGSSSQTMSTRSMIVHSSRSSSRCHESVFFPALVSIARTVIMFIIFMELGRLAG